MGNKVITSVGELAPWLDEHRWFHDGRLLAVYALGPKGTVPKLVALDLETIVRDGGYRAGNMQTIRTVRLQAEGVREWSCKVVPEGFPYQFNGDGVYLVDGERGVAIDIAAPEDPYTRLVCERLVVTESRDRVQRIAPFVQPSWVSATVPKGAMPTPVDWVDAFRVSGRYVVWRYYAGKARAAESVPSADYTGWFLQLPERVGVNEYGLFFAWAKPKGEGFELSLELRDEEARKALWPVACEVVGGFPEPVIQSGNCFFTAAEWRRFLKDGAFPVPA